MTIGTGTTRPIRSTLRALTIGLVFASGSAAIAQQATPISPDLTPKLRELLRNEMLSIEIASHQILSALIAGEDARVAELAQQVHDSFILEQSMTPQDSKDLMAAVPEDFVTRDHAFHELSATLAEAGRSGDRTRQQQEFGRMIEACTACHTLYATDRFPKLAK
jgi:hypothetical protein